MSIGVHRDYSGLLAESLVGALAIFGIYSLLSLIFVKTEK